MKILHINSYYVDSPFYSNIFTYQRKRNDVTVYVHMKKGRKNTIEDQACIIGRPYRDIEKFFYFTKHRKIWNDLTGKIDISQFDIVHAHSLFSNGFEAYRVFAAYKIPYVVSVRNTDINKFYKFGLFLHPLALNILLNAKAIIFLSEPYKEYLIEKYVPKAYKESIQKKAFVITNGIDDFWVNNTNRHDKSDSVFRIITAGVINKNKNHLQTCKALQILKSKGYKVSFEIYGKIENYDIYDDLCDYGFVKYHEAVGKEKLMEAYRNNDIFVMPSIHETFGLVYAEAMSQGLLVIFTRGQGFDGQYTDGTVGYAVDAFDTQELADAIERCFLEYTRISDNCVALVSNYKWDAINKRIEQLYEALH